MSKITTERHYKIIFPDGSTYYGRTTQPDNDRYYRHLGEVKRGKHSNKHIQELYNKYGSDDWVHEWLSTKIGDIEHHRQIEFGYVQADPKALNIDDGRKSLLSKEVIVEYQRLRIQRKIDNMTPKELKEYRLIKREEQSRRRANETPEQREKRLEGMRNYFKRNKNNDGDTK